MLNNLRKLQKLLRTGFWDFCPHSFWSQSAEVVAASWVSVLSQGQRRRARFLRPKTQAGARLRDEVSRWPQRSSQCDVIESAESFVPGVLGRGPKWTAGRLARRAREPQIMIRPGPVSSIVKQPAPEIQRGVQPSRYMNLCIVAVFGHAPVMARGRVFESSCSNGCSFDDLCFVPTAKLQKVFGAKEPQKKFRGLSAAKVPMVLMKAERPGLMYRNNTIV